LAWFDLAGFKLHGLPAKKLAALISLITSISAIYQILLGVFCGCLGQQNILWLSDLTDTARTAFP